MCLPAAWWTAAYAARRTTCHLPNARCFQSKPQWAATRWQAIVQAGLLPFKDVVADGLSGHSPALLEAVDACGGVPTFVAMPSETRGWLQRPRTEDKPSTEKGDVRAQRGVVAPNPAPRSVAAWAASLPAASWDQRPVSEGTQGPRG